MTREQLEAFAEALAEEWEEMHESARLADDVGRDKDARHMRQAARIFMGLSKACTKVAAKEAIDPLVGQD